MAPFGSSKNARKPTVIGTGSMVILAPLKISMLNNALLKFYE
ncbi:MAG: hypothetical protein ACFFA8_06810 [Promethearchaeota archaeon]